MPQAGFSTTNMAGEHPERFVSVVKKHSFLLPQYLVFSFTLPVCLHLREGYDFLIKTEGTSNHFIIVTKEYVEGFDPRHGEGKNVEVFSDSVSAFRFTRISVLFPDYKPEIPLEGILRRNEKNVLKAVNHFLNCYRYTTGRSGVRNIYSLTSCRDLRVERGEKEGIRNFLIVINFGKEGVLSPFLPLRNLDEHKRLQSLTTSLDSIPLESLLLMDARRYAIDGHDAQAIINAVTALEIVVNKKNTKLNFIQKILVNFIKGYGFRARVVKILKATPTFPEKLIVNVISAIKDRHRVVHRGKALKGNIDQHLNSVEKAVNALKDN